MIKITKGSANIAVRGALESIVMPDGTSLDKALSAIEEYLGRYLRVSPDLLEFEAAGGESNSLTVEVQVPSNLTWECN